jgi:predicted nucleic acid-binding Zn ribbon protein
VPFYEYRRPDGTILEVMQKMTDPPLAEDPDTGVPLERVFHPIAVHFKGKGFYNTDYGTKKRAREKAAESESSAKKDDKQSTDAKTETKSDAPKTEAKASSSPSTTSSDSSKKSTSD